VGFGQTVCLPQGRKCGDCDLGLQGLCKAADRGKVIAGRKKKEEFVLKDENDVVVEKIEVFEEKIKVEDGMLDKGDGSEDAKPQVHSVANHIG